MARKLVVSNTVQVPVVAVITNATGKAESFKFTLTCRRLPGDDLRKQLGREDLPVNSFLADITTGWSGQQLLLEDDGTPSIFSAEAFDDLLSVAGVPGLCLAAYMKEVVAKEKN